MTPISLISSSALVLLVSFAIGLIRYWNVNESDDWLDVSDGRGDEWDRLLAVTAVLASTGISLGCLWGFVQWVKY